MGPIVYQAGDVVLGHLRKLLLKDAFQAGEDDQTFALVVVVDDPELDFSVALFNHRRLRNIAYQLQQAADGTNNRSTHLLWKRDNLDRLLFRLWRRCMGVLDALASGRVIQWVSRLSLGIYNSVSTVLET